MAVAQTMRMCARICAGIICAGAVLLSAPVPAQNLYVAANGYSNPVLPIGNQPSGTIYQVIPGESPGIFARDLGTAVRGLTFNPSGDLFALSASPLGSIIQITPNGTKSTYASGISSPFDLAFNSSGNLFVTEGAAAITPQIVEITPGGGVTTFASGFVEPRGLAFNKAGDLFVADLGTSNILEITPGGTKSVFASGLSGPFGLAFNSAGDLFAADTVSGDITEFAPNGIESTYATGLDHPRYLAFDNTGDLFVSNLGNPGTDDADNDGYLTEITPDGTETSFDYGFLNLSGVAFSPVPEPSAVELTVIACCLLPFISRMTRPRRPHT
jgi:DNA-binding beta-propeller fold protein YncE